MNSDKLFWVLFLTLTLIFPAGQLSAYPQTDADFALLPPYCKARSGRTSSADAENWARRIGKGWTDIHHYCSGLDHLNKAKMATDSKIRIRQLNSAIHSFTGFQESIPRESVLQPEISTQTGRAYLMLDQVGAALKEFYNAIKINPKYTPAYSELADYYRDNNKPEEARKILEQGLKKNPKSKSLKRRLNEL